MSTPDLKNSPADVPVDDPLAHLHKMSTTAGLGSGDYVAVNGTAVFAAICGLASPLALMHEVFLVLPLLSVISAIVAWRQINMSNNTQTGKGLAVLAIVLSLGFGGFVFARQIAQTVRTRDDRSAVGKRVAELADHVKAGNLDAANAMFTERFKAQYPRERFDTEMKALRENAVFGKLTGASWNGLVDFQTDEATGTQYAVTGVNFEFEKGRGFRENPVFRKVDGQWQIESLPQIFPPPERPPSR